MKSNRGQALIEFIIVLPILILIISCFIDLSKIIYTKYQLQNELSVLVELNKNNKLDKYDKYDIDITKDETYTTIVVKTNVIIATPIINNILGKNYEIEEEVVVLNE